VSPECLCEVSVQNTFFNLLSHFCQDHYRKIDNIGLAVWFCFGQELPAHPRNQAWIRAGRAKEPGQNTKQNRTNMNDHV